MNEIPWKVTIADHLSCWHLSPTHQTEFSALTATHTTTELHCPADLFNFCVQCCVSSLYNFMPRRVSYLCFQQCGTRGKWFGVLSDRSKSVIDLFSCCEFIADVSRELNIKLLLLRNEIHCYISWSFLIFWFMEIMIREKDIWF